MDIRKTRYKVLALAPFHTDEEHSWQKSPLPVRKTTLDAAMEEVAPKLYLPLEKTICPDQGLGFHFNGIKSLHPDGLVSANPYLAQLNRAIAFVADARRRGTDAETIRQGLHQWPDLPRIEIDGNDDRPSHKKSKDDKIDDILSMVAIGDGESLTKTPSHSKENQFQAIAGHILSRLYTNAHFRQLESAWRGLKLMLQQGCSGNDPAPDVAIAPIHAETLAETLASLTEHLLDDLPNLIVLDLPFDNTPLSIERLTTVAQWAGTLMVPTIAWVGPDFFQLSDWRGIQALPFLPNHLDSGQYAKFRKLQTSTDAQWLCLTCNRFLVRFPYGPDNPPRKIEFIEDGAPWESPIWALGALICQRVSGTGWPTRFDDIQTSFIKNLALNTLSGTSPIVSEIMFDSDRLVQFTRAGFSPLAARSERDSAFFPKVVTVAGSSLAYQLLLSQSTKFILWCKDNFTWEESPETLQSHLTEALHDFSNQGQTPGFSSLRVNTDSSTHQGTIAVHITLIPNKNTIGTDQPIELHLNW